MSSIDDQSRIVALFDALGALDDRLLETDFDSLNRQQLVAIWECYGFLLGRLAAFEYELTSPFVRVSGHR
jgi:hypothetical protein